MNRMNPSIKIGGFAMLLSVMMIISCSQPKDDDPGSEYMPDMAHSIAYEANIYNYYYNNTWDEASVKKLKELSIPRKPVTGTIPRGYAGVHYSTTTTGKNAVMAMHKGMNSTSSISIPVNGSVPYHYNDTEEERTRAMSEIIYNPFPISEKGLATGKELYDINCGICHGKKGDGNGYLVADENPNAKYPAQPANFLSDEFVAASNGRYYHSIMYGKNVMGGYADKLSYEERWNVIHYIRSLQAKEKKVIYTAEANTLNNIAVPIKTLEPIAEVGGQGSADQDAGHGEGGHDGQNEGDHRHGHDHGGEHHDDGHSHDGDNGHDH